MLSGIVVHGFCTGQSLPATLRTGVYGKVQSNALCFAANQAALGAVKNFEAALYVEKPFLLQALSVCHFAVAQPVGDGSFGLQLRYGGNSDYNSAKLGIAYGRTIGAKAAVGVQFNYWSRHISGYESTAQVTVEGGFLFHFSDAFHAGFQVCHPAGVVLSKSGKKIPALYTAGLTYQPSQSVSLTTEIAKSGALPVALQTGLQYRFAPALWAKAGINSTKEFFIAARFQLNGFAIEFSGSVHAQLGLSPGLMLAYNMDK